MPDKIITPNEKVNEHIESVREVMGLHNCHADLILMCCEIIDVAYDYGRHDQLMIISGKTDEKA